MSAEFCPFQSIPRLFRNCVVTEKIDGTNAVVHVSDAGAVSAGSRSRWITPEDDNFGFAAWVRDHAEELRSLGPGFHYGEWWGKGIHRGYGLDERRFSLFNVARWDEDGRDADKRPACCHVVPVLASGEFDTEDIRRLADALEQEGSIAAPDFMKPEGIVVYHEASRHLYKYTLDGDGHKKAKVKR